MQDLDERPLFITFCMFWYVFLAVWPFLAICLGQYLLPLVLFFFFFNHGVLFCGSFGLVFV